LRSRGIRFLRISFESHRHDLPSAGRGARRIEVYYIIIIIITIQPVHDYEFVPILRVLPGRRTVFLYIIIKQSVGHYKLSIHHRAPKLKGPATRYSRSYIYVRPYALLPCTSTPGRRRVQARSGGHDLAEPPTNVPKT